MREVGEMLSVRRNLNISSSDPVEKNLLESEVIVSSLSDWLAKALIPYVSQQKQHLDQVLSDIKKKTAIIENLELKLRRW